MTLDLEEYSTAQDASNVAKLTKQMREMVDTLRNVFKEMKELRKDVQHFPHQLSEHIASCSNEAVVPLANLLLLAPPQELGTTKQLESSLATPPLQQAEHMATQQSTELMPPQLPRWQLLIL